MSSGEPIKCAHLDIHYAAVVGDKQYIAYELDLGDKAIHLCDLCVNKFIVDQLRKNLSIIIGRRNETMTNEKGDSRRL